MEIRKLTRTDDRKAISNIYEESWKYAYRGIVPNAYLESIPKGRWANSVDSPERYTLLMLDDDKIIGTLSYCKFMGGY